MVCDAFADGPPGQDGPEEPAGPASTGAPSRPRMFQTSGVYPLLQWVSLMSPSVGVVPCVSTQARITPFLTGRAWLGRELPAPPPRAVETPTTRATSAATTRYFILTPFYDRAPRRRSRPSHG